MALMKILEYFIFADFDSHVPRTVTIPAADPDPESSNRHGM